MAASVLQEVSSEDANFTTNTTTITLSATLTAGSVLLAFVTHDTGGGSPAVTVADTVNGTWPAALLDREVVANGQRLLMFGFVSSGAGSTTVTATLGTANVAKGLWLIEVSGASTSAGAIDKVIGNDQAAVATTTDAITSTLLGTLSSPNALIVGFCIMLDDVTAQVAGTGFTSTKTAWKWSGTNNGTRSENQHVSATTSVAATFTGSIASRTYITFAAAILDPTTAQVGPSGASAFSIVGPGRVAHGTNPRFRRFAEGSPANVSFALTGNSGASAVGTPVPGTTVALTGNQATGSAGAVNVSGSSSAALSGTAATGSPGTLTSSATIAVTGNAATSAVGSVTVPSSRFGYSIDPGGRYFIDEKGQPFPFLSRSWWGFMGLTPTEKTQAIADLVSSGYTGVEFATWKMNDKAPSAPFDGSGNAPFLKNLAGGTWVQPLAGAAYANAATDAADLTQPNPAYWASFDAVMDALEAARIIAMFFPLYCGFSANQWMIDMNANSTANVQGFGAFIGARCAQRKNIIWMIGGDRGTGGNLFTTADKASEQALIDGILSASPASRGIAAEWHAESIFDDNSDFTLTGFTPVQSAYAFSGFTAHQCRRAWSANHGPVTVQEEPFAGEGPPPGNGDNGSATDPLRRFGWWGWLDSIAGHQRGDVSWRFLTGWQFWLTDPTAVDAQIRNHFIRSIAWWKLVPSNQSGMRVLIPSGGGSSDTDTSYVSSACATDGKLLLAYVPPAHSGAIGVDLRSMVGTLRARWMDPTTGAFTAIPGFFTPAASSQSFTVPGTNAEGTFTDWVLVVDSVDATPTGRDSFDIVGPGRARAMVPRRGFFASPDRTASLTGDIGTGAAGNSASSTTVATTGITSTGSTGTTGAALTVSVTGASVTGAAGTSTPSTTVAPSGVTATGVSGAATAAPAFGLTGVPGGGSVGSIAPGTAAAVTGNQATGAVGVVVDSLAVGATGVVGTSSVGTAGVSITVPITGVQAAGTLGAVGASTPGSTAVTGVASTGSAGIFGPVVTTASTGVQAAGSVGTVTATQGISAAITAVSATASIGTPVPSLTIGIGGVSSSGVVGSMSTGQDAGAVLTGVFATGSVGTMAMLLQVTGVVGMGSVGSMTQDHGGTVSLVGIGATGQVGTMTTSGVTVESFPGRSAATTGRIVDP